jgi:hypothetical protein
MYPETSIFKLTPPLSSGDHELNSKIRGNFGSVLVFSFNPSVLEQSRFEEGESTLAIIRIGSIEVIHSCCT